MTKLEHMSVPKHLTSKQPSSPSPIHLFSVHEFALAVLLKPQHNNMGWPYHFVDLNDAQKTDRRRLLNYYGTLAQLSALAPLLLLQCYFAAKWLNRRWQTDGGVPGSPRAKLERSMGFSNDAKATLRKLQWWSSSRCAVLGFHLGTSGEVIAAGGWTAWLLLLCFLQTDDGILAI